MRLDSFFILFVFFLLSFYWDCFLSNRERKMSAKFLDGDAIRAAGIKHYVYPRLPVESTNSASLLSSSILRSPRKWLWIVCLELKGLLGLELTYDVALSISLFNSKTLYWPACLQLHFSLSLHFSYSLFSVSQFVPQSAQWYSCVKWSAVSSLYTCEIWVDILILITGGISLLNYCTTDIHRSSRIEHRFTDICISRSWFVMRSRNRIGTGIVLFELPESKSSIHSS